MGQIVKKPFSKIKVLRIWSENDPLVPIEDLHKNLNKFVTKTVIAKGGGHCAVNRDKQTVEEIRAWNKEMVASE